MIDEFRNGAKPIDTITYRLLHKNLQYTLTYFESGEFAGSYGIEAQESNVATIGTILREEFFIQFYSQDYAPGKWYAPTVYYLSLYRDGLIEEKETAIKELSYIITSEYTEIPEDNDEVKESPCPRAYMALVFATYIPEENLQPTKEVGEIPDLNVELVRRLYNAGIMGGVDDEGTFDGHGTLTRAQLAAIVARIINPDLRLVIIIL